MQPALGYIRVSSEQQAGETRTSLDDQRTAIAALALRVGAEVVRTFEDPGISGATVAKRPGLVALFAYCEENKRRKSEPGYVFILNDSRLGRFDDPDEAAYLRFRLKGLGWIVKFAESDDIADPSLRHIMRAVGSAQASEYRRNLRANSTRGRMGTGKQGFWTGREPFGYHRMVVFPPGRERVLPYGVIKTRDERIKLTPGPTAEVQTVQDLFALYATGAWSLHALERYAKSLQLGTDTRPMKWSVPTITNILKNHAYAGRIAGRKQTATRMELGDHSKREPEYLVHDAHERLVDEETWQAVQRQLLQLPPRGDVHDYRLRGIVRCVHCEDVFVGGGLGRGYRDDGERTRFYVCRKGREGDCGDRAGCISSHILEAGVVEAFAAHLATQLTPKAIRAAFEARLGTPRDRTPRVDVLARAIADATTRRNNVINAIERGTINDEEAAGRLEQLRAEIARLEAEHVRHQQRIPATPAAVQSQLDQMVAKARDAVSLAAIATGPELRALIAPWVDSMTFDYRSRVLTTRFKTLPALFAGVNLGGCKFTVIRRGGTTNPEFASAACTRSRLSFTAVAASPTSIHWGSPLATCTSTVTSRASMPRTAADRAAASMERWYRQRTAGPSPLHRIPS